MAVTLARLNVIVGADISRLEKQLGKVTSSVTRTGRELSRIGQTLTATVTLPIAGIGAAATKMASDAEEAANKFNVVFGDAAGRVSNEIDRLRETIPEARHELVGMAAGIQDLLVPLGLAPDAAADMSVKILELAGDLASFNNLRLPDVLRDIRSGLVGQSEPLLKFGADTRVAAVEAKALELGLIKEGQELTNTARALAVYNIVLDSNVAAQGDAARTADGAANSFKFFVAEVKDLGVALGRVLLPVVTPLVQNLTDMLKGMNDMTPGAKRLTVAIAGVAAAVGPLLIVLGGLAKLIPIIALGLTSWLGPLALVAVAVGAATAKFVDSKLKAAALKGELEAVRSEILLLSDADRKVRMAKTVAEYEKAQRAANEARQALADFRAEPGETSGLGVAQAAQMARLSEAVNEAEANLNRLENELGALAIAEQKAAEASRPLTTELAKVSTETENAAAKIRETLHTSLEVARSNARLFGKDFDFAGARLAAFETALQALLELGIKPTDAGVMQLASSIKALREDFGGVEQSIQRIEGVPVLARFTESALEASLGVGTLRGTITAASGATREFGEVNREEAMRAGQAWLESQKVLESFKDIGIGFVDQFSQAFADMATGSADAFKNFVKSAINQLTALIAKILIVKALGAIFPGFGEFFGGTFARGGFLEPGKFGIVGERGPELVTAGPAGAAIEPLGGMALTVDTSSLPPYPRAVTPDALAVDDYWRRFFHAATLDFRDRGGRF